MSTFLSCTVTDLHPSEFVSKHGHIEQELSYRTQGSGNVSWLIETAERRLFVKSAGQESPPPPGAPDPYFDHAGRVRLLRNAVKVAHSCRHPALPELLNVIESASGPMLVYEAVAGDLIGVTSKPTPEGSAHLFQDPTSSYQRFARLPAGELLTYIDTVIDLHRDLAAAGWIASDLYDGCLIVDFASQALHVIDLDNYRKGVTQNDMGRMFGSGRFMAPEEFELGVTIDQRTTVFNLGRLAWHFCTRLSESEDEFCGSPALAAVVKQATAVAPEHRQQDVAEFAAAWEAGRRRA